MVHGGHRQRLRERFRQEGLKSFNDINALELLLFYCVPRSDTNPIAHRLLDRFGSLADVLEAPAEELEKVEGVGPNVSTYLNLVMETIRYYRVEEVQKETILRTVDDCGKYLLPHFLGSREEIVFLLCLDAKCKVLCCREIGRGSVNTAGVSSRRIMEVALGVNATTVVLAHNHPSGFAIPSNEDIMTTKRLMKALKTVDVALADHLVISDGDYVSMAQSGYITAEDAVTMV